MFRASSFPSLREAQKRMSGHSKWSTIKHKKAITDKKRADAFGKIARAIIISAQQRGGDPDSNYELRGLVQKARALNMPRDKIEYAIKKGAGELAGEKLEELLVEAYGPGGVALLISAITDNRNRTAAELRSIVNKHEGKVAGEGSVQWMFKQYGALHIPRSFIQDTEAFELTIIDAGAQDIQWNPEEATVYTEITDLTKTLKSLREMGYNEVETGLEWVAKNTIAVEGRNREKLEKLYEALDENDNVQEIYSNTKE